jgi:hypothetical protein
LHNTEELGDLPPARNGRPTDSLLPIRMQQRRQLVLCKIVSREANLVGS